MKGQRTPGSASALRTPAIVFHGDADPTVHPSNGDALFASVLPGDGTLHQDRPAGAGIGDRPVTRRRRIAADGRVLAEQWVLHGAGHAWSGGSTTGSHTDPRGPCASRALFEFFRGHRLNSRSD
jgi:poly(3-hydroxybutyrate) depolymerase